ncbi:DUF461 domain-containing protein [Streptomyces sp. UNOB3_S3]|uniref:DUF461 domain-containing protein n=1 Tax=Streptomyces sp. UNOB3_S3 TaxID=2871682 RepID=UPI001E468991|nr:DUF461 domain-containing protein [Streptomyces sp. UNOB3_S3]MCC3774614.1 DUF461 domain-containing protein [Streptomyces sp. UNOB3_S3]
MSSSLRRGALAASALVVSIASLSACAAGNKAQTLEVKPDNAATSVGDIKLQNVNVITQEDLKAGGPAVITGKVFNNGRKDQELRSIKLAGLNVPVNLSPAKGSGPVVVPAGGSIVLGGKDNPSAVLPKGREGLKDGATQRLAFDFSSTGEVKIAAFVVPAKSFFKEWGPSQAPATQPSGTPSAPAGSPSAPAGAAEGQPQGAGHQAGTKPGATAPATQQSGQQQHTAH